MNDSDFSSATASPETATAVSGDPDAYVDLVRGILRRIVDEPEVVEVTASRRSRGIVLDVSVARGDMGKVIGKGGRNIDAIRAVARAAGLRHHERVQVELVEDEVADEN